MDTPTQQVIKWHLNILPKNTQKAIHYFSTATWLQNSKWYLAGGTALALQVGHRSSVDLDFFNMTTRFSEEELIGHLPKESWKTTILREGTIYGELLKAKASFIAYPFFIPKIPYQFYGHIPILSLHDIAVMKIIAISQRGKKRDFLDLFWYCQHQNHLFDVILRLKSQYPTVTHNYHHILKSLLYFEDAEKDPMPEIYFKATWKEIKGFFQREVPFIARKLLRI